MEHGSYTDLSKSTFSLMDEDHTFANSLRFTLNQDPRVTFCGYSIPHPSENRVNVRLQTTGKWLHKLCHGGYNVTVIGDPACEVLKDGCQDLMLVCQHVRNTFEKAVNDFKTSKTEDDMDI